jgi:hypothetical protein
VAAGLKNHQVAELANEALPPSQYLTEQAISKIITGRSRPSSLQKEMLGRVLGCGVIELFDC